MTRLTVAMDERVSERARSRASQQGTSLDALVRSYVETYAGGGQGRVRSGVVQQEVLDLLDEPISRRGCLADLGMAAKTGPLSLCHGTSGTLCHENEPGGTPMRGFHR